MFPVCRCAGCGLLYLNPRPTAEEQSAAYPAGYGPHHAAADGAASNRGRRRDVSQRIAWIERFVPGRGRALDVGCATGLILEGLRARGWDVSGVEPGAAPAACARERLGLDVRTGSLEEARFPDGSFDLVCFWHTLEHVPDPRATLAEAARVARPGATLLVSLPDPDSAMARRFGPAWCGWDVPRHLCLFPRHVLARMIGETGWRDTQLFTRGGRHWTLTLSLRNWARARLRSEAAARLLVGATSSPPFHALARPVYALLERLGRGPNLMALARR